LLSASLLSALSAVTASPAAEEPAVADPADQEEIILRILDLRQQIEDLLDALPQEVREEVERRWLEQQAASTAEPQPSEPEAVTALPPATVTPTPEPAAAAEPPCGRFYLLDSNEDTLVTGGDRQWRFLRLWFDNGDSNLEESEIESLFDLGVRAIDVELRFYTNDEGQAEDIDVDDLIWLRLVGDNKSGSRSGALVVEADRLARGGILRLTDTQGTVLSGFQPLGAEYFLETEDGVRIPVLCAESEPTP